MSVMAWDGLSIAADKQATCAGMRFTVRKLRVLPSSDVLCVVGDMDAGMMVMRWYEEGADPAKWPSCQSHDKDWCRLFVANKLVLKVYERQPVSYEIDEPFFAHGSGRDYAMAAMACGKSAKDAVEIAGRFDNGCGMGIDVVRFA